MLAKLSPISQIRWIGVKNTSGSPIPGFGAMNVTGVDTASTGWITVNGPPTVDGQECLFNGPVAIPANYNGIGTRDFPLYALYYTPDGTPTAGQQWGAAAGFFQLRAGKAGFLIYGGAIAGRVKVVPILAGSSVVVATGTKAAELRVTSTSPGALSNGMYPANVQAFTLPGGVPTFSDTAGGAQNAWLITTNKNPLQLSYYTASFLANGGTPAFDIYCVNENLTVSGPGGTFAGINALNFTGTGVASVANPSTGLATVTITAGAGSNQAAVRVTSRNSPNNDHLFPGVIQSFTPPSTFADTNGGAQNAWVLSGNLNEMEDIIYSDLWLIGTGGTPSFGIYSLFDNFSTEDSAGNNRFLGVNKLIFDAPLTWTLTNPTNGVSKLKRLLSAQTSGGVQGPVNDLKLFTFQPDNCWNLSAGAAGEVVVERYLFVNSLAQIKTISFNSDFTVGTGGTGVANVATSGFTGSIVCCDPSGVQHTINVVDGLIKTVTTP